ncbi:MAG: Nif11-like leader peptide family RiPP precursor [Gammaproteobacteria bacterium]
MSIESFEAFMTRLGDDEKLREELRNEAPQGLTFDQLADAAAARGFSFSAEDITGAQGRELSDAELAGVTGGTQAAFKFSVGNELAQKVLGQQKLDAFSGFKLVTNSIFKF